MMALADTLDVAEDEVEGTGVLPR
jgi:hypothetical protein